MDFFRVFLQHRLDETVLCYDLHKEETASIDPRADVYFISEAEHRDGLNAGVYYMTQLRKDKLGKTELIEAAVELQKEALWIRLVLEPVLYVRVLFEDNSPVTQLWRPLAPKPASPATRSVFPFTV